jgi:hypothetical protein
MRTYRILVGVIALAIGAVLSTASSADEKPKAGTKEDLRHSQHFWDCAKACNDCGRVCDACAAHCIKLVGEGKKEHIETARTCQDCATICAAAAAVTARTGPFSDAICIACADSCKRCGDACDKFKDDPIMKNCTDECRKCEKACREMLKHTGHRTTSATIDPKR